MFKALLDRSREVSFGKVEVGWKTVSGISFEERLSVDKSSRCSGGKVVNSALEDRSSWTSKDGSSVNAFVGSRLCDRLSMRREGKGVSVS